MSTGQSTSAPRAETVAVYLRSAHESINSAIADLQSALNVASYMGRNSELLRQLNITRTQLQTADLWAESAQHQIAHATEEHGS